MDKQGTPQERREELARLKAGGARVRASECVASLLSSADSIWFEGFVSQEQEAVSPVWVHQQLARYDTEPLTAVHEHADRLAILAWLSESLDRLGRDEVYLVSLGGQAQAPWAVVRVPDGTEWLIS